MTLLLVNVLLALAWTAVTGSFTLMNIAFGFVLGALALHMIRAQVGTLGYVDRAGKLLSLAWSFVWELIVASFRVATIVLSPRMDIKPGIFVYPLTVDRDFEITLLTSLLTLTPGTLSVDVSEDRRFLYVHALDCSDPDTMIHDIKQGFEKMILEAFR
jgi:multicomponent Na+:H+ antiporter subunit E